mgnify:CR=1 FL=1
MPDVLDDGSYRMSEQLEVLKTVARRLEDAGIPYMVSCSTAMNFYAQPRMTRDIDIVIQVGERDAARVAGLFSKDFFVDEQDVKDAIRALGMFNVIHQDSVVKVDFIIRKGTPYRLMEFQRRRRVDLPGFQVMVVAPEDLLLSKLDWAKESHSELQMKDARNLVESVPDLDWDYVRYWADQLKIAGLLKEIQPG